MTIPFEGWLIILPIQDFLQIAMNVKVELVSEHTLEGWKDWSKAIVAGTRDHLPVVGEELEGPKDYEIRVSPDRIVVCGFDPSGVRFGLFDLEERMSLREAPFLPKDLHTVRHSLFKTRMVLSWLGWMEWPDAYLSHLAHDGYDAIFASVYANPNGVEGPPHYHLIRKQNADNLHDLIRRANRQGIKVYAPVLYNNTGTPENEAGLREHVRDIVTKFPDIHGYILLTEGFYYKAFFGAGGHGGQDLKEWAKHWTRAVEIATEEIHKIDPNIEVLPWEYNIDFRPHRVELKRYVVSLLPKETIPLLTWENGKAFEIDGLKGYLRDYSISQVGPAEVAAGQIEEAKSRGMKVYCKADCFATWQFGTIPYLPCPQQWQRRYDTLAEYGVDGTLETWSNGYKPNFIAGLRAWSAWTDSPPSEDILRSIARREFGAGSEDLVMDAWEHFSRAIQYVPDTGPSMGTNNAVANPLFFEPAEPRIMMLDHSWWDEQKWSHRITGHKMNPYWPYTHARMVFYPDFTNRSNRAEQYARTWSGIGQIENPEKLNENRVLPVFNKHLLLAADEFEKGLLPYRQAALSAPESKREGAMKEVMVAEQIRNMLLSLNAILEFEDLRFRLVHLEADDPSENILGRMKEILRDEIERTERSLVIAERDSRLGYECEQDYVYTPYVLREKIRLLKDTLNDQVPSYEKREE
ncbi:MAG: hypothetical protein H6752_00790 [Candidatus Omnitrophica bacterium]|nr:hypothetical protein [Candidatus Omnitrophota bacterium]